MLRSHAHRPFIVAELGARWGTWAARALAFARAQRPSQPLWAHAVEPRPVHCLAVHEVMSKNLLGNYSLHCGNAESRRLRRWLRS